MLVINTEESDLRLSSLLLVLSEMLYMPRLIGYIMIFCKIIPLSEK